MEQYLFDKMKREHRWSFSNDFDIDITNLLSEKEAEEFIKTRKRPLFAGDYIEARKYDTPPKCVNLLRDYYEDDEKNLNTYEELNYPELIHFKRAYRFNAINNFIVGLDIEPDTSDKFLDVFSRIPAHFAEWSTNNGLHLFYQLDPHKLSSNAQQLLIQPVKKVQLMAGPEETHLKYELMMNDHWLTFTGKVNKSQIVPLSHPVPEQVYKLIEDIAQEDAERKIEMIEIAMDSKAHTETSTKLIEWLENSSQLDEFRELTPEMFNNDMSLYEYNVLLRISGFVRYKLDNAQPFDAMRLGGINPALVSDQDAIRVVYYFGQSIIPGREKHKTMRDQMPWLLSQSRKAYQYIKSSK